MIHKPYRLNFKSERNYSACLLNQAEAEESILSNKYFFTKPQKTNKPLETKLKPSP